MTAYEGKEKYIFASYAHKNSSVVLPIIDALQQEGFRVWYDKGIEAGTEWPEYIEEHLEKSEIVVVFMSNAAVESRNCRNEINLALDMNKEILVVYLEDTELKRGLKLQVGSSQSIFYHRQPHASFLRELFRARILSSCRHTVRGGSPVPPPVGNDGRSRPGATPGYVPPMGGAPGQVPPVGHSPYTYAPPPGQDPKKTVSPDGKELRSWNPNGYSQSGNPQNKYSYYEQKKLRGGMLAWSIIFSLFMSIFHLAALADISMFFVASVFMVLAGMFFVLALSPKRKPNILGFNKGLKKVFFVLICMAVCFFLIVLAAL